MENRKPYSLKNTIILYNLTQIIVNGYVFLRVNDNFFFQTALVINLKIVLGLRNITIIKSYM